MPIKADWSETANQHALSSQVEMELIVYMHTQTYLMRTVLYAHALSRRLL